jgi:hypothetical protein
MAGISRTSSCGHGGPCECQDATKRCAACGQWLPKDEAHFYLYATGYFSSTCHSCARKRALAWRHDHLDRARKSPPDPAG